MNKLNNFRVVFLIGLSGSAFALSGCGPSEGSKEWCDQIEHKPQTELSIHDGQVYNEKCVQQQVEAYHAEAVKIMDLMNKIGDKQMAAFAEEAKIKAQKLQSALDLMKLDIGRYPTTSEGLQLLFTKPEDSQIKENWQGPYFKGPLPLDPSNRPYVYSFDGKNPKLCTAQSSACWSW